MIVPAGVGRAAVTTASSAVAAAAAMVVTTNCRGIFAALVTGTVAVKVASYITLPYCTKRVPLFSVNLAVSCSLLHSEMNCLKFVAALLRKSKCSTVQKLFTQKRYKIYLLTRIRSLIATDVSSAIANTTTRMGWLICSTGQENTVDVDATIGSILGDHYCSHVPQLGQLHHSRLHPDVHERSAQV